MAKTKYAFFEGQIVPIERAKVSIMTHAFNYGTGCFEGIRAYWNGEDKELYLLKMQEHYQRLHRSCRIINIRLPYDVDTLGDITLQLLRKEKFREDTYIRPLAYKSTAGVGVRLHDLEDQFAIFATPFGKYIEKHQDLTKRIIDELKKLIDLMLKDRRLMKEKLAELKKEWPRLREELVEEGKLAKDIKEMMGKLDYKGQGLYRRQAEKGADTKAMVELSQKINRLLKEIEAIGCSEVLVALQENNIHKLTGPLRFAAQIAEHNGLRPYACIWGYANTFGGGRMSNFLLNDTDMWRVQKDGTLIPLACLNNPSLVDHFLEITEMCAENGYRGMFIDEPGPQECFCPHCQKRFRESHGGDLTDNISDEKYQASQTN